MSRGQIPIKYVGRIVVERDKLHPKVRDAVDRLLLRREARKRTASYGFIEGSMIGFLLATMSQADTNIMGKAAAPLILGAGSLPILFGYKMRSKGVRTETQAVEKAIRNFGIDAKKEIEISEVKETHPFAFINWKGDVVLVPETTVQKALYKAQQTFFKHVTPGRYRAKL